MSKRIGELDWSNLMSGDVGEPEDPRSAPLDKPLCEPTLKKGEIPRKPSNDEIASYILKGASNQWKDDDHLHKEIVSQAEADQLQKNWENTFQNHFDQLNKPVEPQTQEKEWGDGQSFNDSLTDEERLKRNMFTGDQPDIMYLQLNQQVI